MNINTLIDNLNNPNAKMRLQSLKELISKVEAGEIEKPVKGMEVNNHIHSFYSFSPYSPTKAIWMAYTHGLSTAGIMDHDSVGGALEFIEAGKIAGIATTIGVELRADFSKTPLKGKKLNNPDQSSIAYMTIHGIPHTKIDAIAEFLAPYVKERNIRNRQMVDKINEIIKSFDISLDFDRDIVPLSKSTEDGTITERHISLGLSNKLIEAFGKGEKLLDFLKNRLRLSISPKIAQYLSDKNNVYYEYDLLGLIKAELMASFYIDATSECPDIKNLIAFSDSIGAILAYPYLGDVGDSVTGDKKTQKFEDQYIDLLFTVISDLGIKAFTYMPSRNSFPQLQRVRDYCDRLGLFQISGEDINSPRQSFICEALRNAAFDNLRDSTWALIGHETAATTDINKGMFSPGTIEAFPELSDRINIFKEIGLGFYKAR